MVSQANQPNQDTQSLETDLRKTQEHLDFVCETAGIGTWQNDLTTGSVSLDERARRHYGFDIPEVTIGDVLNRVHPEDVERLQQGIAAATDPESNGRITIEYRVIHTNGSIHWLAVGMQVWFEKQVDGRRARVIFGTSQDITESKLAHEKLQTSARTLKLFIDNAPAAIAMFDREMRYLAVSRRFIQNNSLEGQELIGRSHYDVFPEIPHHWKDVHQRCLAGAIEMAEEDRFPRSDGSWDWVRWEIHPWYEQPGEIGGLILFSELITARKLAEEALRESEKRLSLALEAAGMGVWEWNLQTEDMFWSPGCYEITGLESFDNRLVTFTDLVHPEDIKEVLRTAWKAIETKRTFVSEFRLIRPDGKQVWLRDFGRVEYDEQDEPLRLVGTVEDVTARKQAEQQIHLQLQRMEALNKIDRAINSSLDIQLSLDILLRELLSQLGVDAAAILLLSVHRGQLEYIAGKGFYTPNIRHSRMRIGEGLAGQVGLERKVIHVSNLDDAGGAFMRAKLLEDENFVEYFGVPLVAKSSLKGVLEIFNRSHLNPDLEWVNYLETLGGQAAIAIDNAQLFEDMQRSHRELVIAYDATLAGWSHAMDLRDKETEGHTRRVTELTLKLAEKMGFMEAEMVHIRRGALLHDIGKLGVPDEILFKPGPLTEAEWEIMRRHPVHAYHMLLPIHYLRPALDIPYCHHEKWDGSGYPRGLRGEQIPLAARIFAVVDVWDALRSVRPYRANWSEEETRRYIIDQAGKHFDPKVVEIFLEMITPEG